MKTHSTLHLVTAAVRPEHADALSAWLSEEQGLQPVQIERPGARLAWIELYVENAASARAWAAQLRRRKGVASAEPGRCTPRDWLSFWRHHFHAQDIGSRLRICPVWERRKPVPRGRRTIWVDPGASFGTGDHFTTRFCLEMIDRICQKSRPRSFLDVGTGSGILAIAAAKLGCPRVTGTENDPLALRQAVRNVKLNRVASRVALRAEDLAERAPGETCEVVAANLVSGLLLEHADALVRSARRWLLLSGIREMEADAVADAYVQRDAREIVRDGDGEWVGLLLDTTLCH
jgi:ribosomal protein L11 methyltransferase